MSISSVSSTPSVTSTQQAEVRPASEQEVELRRQEYKLQPDKPSDDDRNASSQQRPPLPPGQGTRIDQYV